ncbi:hypothetical protein AABM38_12730 [Heyndrickxia sp. MSNUG]|uniref:hypothetical protein n=1 Tax=Heyndrickxia sp. MSNUG TaxID=3136677 RepID=UPI003C2CF95D
MWNWIILLVIVLAAFLLIEELSQFFWRRYLRNPTESKSSRLSDFMSRAKQMKQKYRKDPSH